MEDDLPEGLLTVSLLKHQVYTFVDLTNNLFLHCKYILSYFFLTENCFSMDGSEGEECSLCRWNSCRWSGYFLGVFAILL